MRLNIYLFIFFWSTFLNYWFDLISICWWPRLLKQLEICCYCIKLIEIIELITNKHRIAYWIANDNDKEVLFCNNWFQLLIVLYYVQFYCIVLLMWCDVVVMNEINVIANAKHCISKHKISTYKSKAFISFKWNKWN